MQEVNKLGVPVTLQKEGRPPVDARSLLGIMTLGVKHGEVVTLAAEGDGADEARDPGLLSAASMQIAEGYGPVDALYHAVEQYCEMLAGLGGYMAERQDDLRDVFQRAGARLMGLPAPGVPALTTPSVLVAFDLAPADTATLDPEKVLGIVTEGGGVTSHTAILAAQLGIPAVVQAPGVMVAQAATVGLDGATGEVVLDPADDVAAALLERNERRLALQAMVQGPGATRDGHAVQILANIGTVGGGADRHLHARVRGVRPAQGGGAHTRRGRR